MLVLFVWRALGSDDGFHSFDASVAGEVRFLTHKGVGGVR